MPSQPQCIVQLHYIVYNAYHTFRTLHVPNDSYDYQRDSFVLYSKQYKITIPLYLLDTYNDTFLLHPIRRQFCEHFNVRAIEELKNRFNQINMKKEKK